VKGGTVGEMNKTMTPYYQEKLEQGQCYQDYIVDLLYQKGIPIISYNSKKYQNMKGENKAGIEIKNDTKFRESGNLYIEIAEKTNANNSEFIPSGIYRNDNTWLYLMGDERTVFVLSKRQLKILHQSGRYKEVVIPTSRGFLLPVKEAREFYCILEIDVIKEKLETLF
jgi:hypothetical protein